MTNWSQEGWEARSIAATLRFYLFSVALLAPLAVAAGIALDSNKAFALTPFFAVALAFLLHRGSRARERSDIMERRLPIVQREASPALGYRMARESRAPAYSAAPEDPVLIARLLTDHIKRGAALDANILSAVRAIVGLLAYRDQDVAARKALFELATTIGTGRSRAADDLPQLGPVLIGAVAEVAERLLQRGDAVAALAFLRPTESFRMLVAVDHPAGVQFTLTLAFVALQAGDLTYAERLLVDLRRRLTTFPEFDYAAFPELPLILNQAAVSRVNDTLGRARYHREALSSLTASMQLLEWGADLAQRLFGGQDNRTHALRTNRDILRQMFDAAK